MILNGLAETILRWVLSCAFGIIILCASGYFFYNGFNEIVERFRGEYCSSYLMGIVCIAFGVVILIVGALVTGIINPILYNYIVVPTPPTV